MTREELVLEIVKRWRNDPSSRTWTLLLHRAAWQLPGVGKIRTDEANTEISNVSLSEQFSIEESR